MIQDKIRELVQYGLLTGLVSAEDEIYTTNRLLELFRIEDYPYGFGEKIEQTEEEAVKRLPDLLTEMMDYAVENGILQEDGIVYRDLFDTKIMSCLVGRPSEIIRRFHEEYEKSPEAATDFFYKFSQDTDYIRRYRVCRDEKWVTPTKYGDLDIINEVTTAEFIAKTLSCLDEADCSLLRSYFDHEQSLSRTSEYLYLHKNTLQYKLDRIHKICGLNPRSFRDGVILYLALRLKEM